MDPHPCPSACGSQDSKESSLHLPRTQNLHPHFLKEVPQRLPTHIQVILTLGPGPLGPHPSNGLRGPVLHQFPHKEQCFYIPSYWLWADIRQLRARLGFREVFWDNRHAHIPLPQGRTASLTRIHCCHRGLPEGGVGMWAPSGRSQGWQQCYELTHKKDEIKWVTKLRDLIYIDINHQTTFFSLPVPSRNLSAN